jgi:hypothetical protein
LRIATDGQIQFAGRDWNAPGGVTSVGLISTKISVQRMPACSHRQLVATWVRQGDAYERQTNLAADVPQAASLGNDSATSYAHRYDIFVVPAATLHLTI